MDPTKLFVLVSLAAMKKIEAQVNQTSRYLDSLDPTSRDYNPLPGEIAELLPVHRK